MENTEGILFTQEQMHLHLKMSKLDGPGSYNTIIIIIIIIIMTTQDMFNIPKKNKKL